MRYEFKQELGRLVKLYKEYSYTIEDWEESSFSRSLKFSEGLPLRKLVNQSLLSGLAPPVVQQFVLKYGEVYIYPIVDLVSIRAFFLRSVTGKDFRVVSDGRAFLCGLNRFKSFVYGKTVFLSEGIKDAEAIATLYPFSVALLGNRIGKEQGVLLQKLTNKIVLVADSDYYGRVGSRQASKNIVVVSCPVSKDLGELFEGGVNVEEIKTYIFTIVNVYT